MIYTSYEQIRSSHKTNSCASDILVYKCSWTNFVFLWIKFQCLWTTLIIRAAWFPRGWWTGRRRWAIRGMCWIHYYISEECDASSVWRNETLISAFCVQTGVPAFLTDMKKACCNYSSFCKKWCMNEWCSPAPVLLCLRSEGHSGDCGWSYCCFYGERLR